MSRQLRIEFEGALYHVMNHGTGRLWLYKDQKFFEHFVYLLYRLKEKYKFTIYSFILMRNHYHLLIQTKEANLSKGMMFFNRELARFYNKEHDRKGKVFKGRFTSKLIEKELYFQTVFRYINQNAKREGIVTSIVEYPGGLWYYLLDSKNELSTILLDIIPLSKTLKILHIRNIHDLVSWLDKGFQELPFSTYDFMVGSRKWENLIIKTFIEKDIEITNDLKVGKLKKRDPDVWKRFQILEQYQNHKEYKNLLVYILNKHTTLTQKEIADKINAESANAVGQRLFKFKQRIKRDSNLKRIIDAIELVVSGKK